MKLDAIIRSTNISFTLLAINYKTPQPMHFLKRFVILTLLFILCLSIDAYSQKKTARKLVIDSNANAVVFVPGVVSTPYAEWSPTFTPDVKTVYFVKGSIYWTIVYSTKVSGKWTTPRIASFSGRWKDSDPFISPDGKKIFFISNRPLENSSEDKAQKNYHIWYAAHLSGNQWGTPHHIDAPVNVNGISNFSPSVSNSGTLYFSSINSDGHKGEACYYSTWNDNHYEIPKMLSLNGNNDTSDLYVSPDESDMIFVSENDFYIVYRKNDEWTMAEKLGPQVNTGDPISSPLISPDGKTFYFTSNRVKGFLPDDRPQVMNYETLLKEMKSIFNGASNILYIPVSIK
jgi:Tol biopolymer transport system component